MKWYWFECSRFDGMKKIMRIIMTVRRKNIAWGRWF